MRDNDIPALLDAVIAEVAESSAATWNAASLGVSHHLGYNDNGISRAVTRPGELVDEQRVRLLRSDFIRPDWELRVEGLEAACKDLLLPQRRTDRQAVL